ncbi:MAG: MBOAT family protein [Proteobacteria bacterium]|nr:MBOAT family protein [Pseudomonadota bacterium]
MLFNSYSFIFAFLPFSLLIYHGLRRLGLERAATLALTLCSLGFYGWWNPVYLLLLVPLTLANYAIAKHIMSCRTAHIHRAKVLLTFGLAANLGVLAYFKYANFLVNNLNALFGLNLFLAQILLPLGISFFTFQKIAFLVDAYRGKVGSLNLLDFSLFVSFFPQLIAGPIVHHSEVLPQFHRKGRIAENAIMLGVTIFTFGLAKKMLLADTAARYASPVFAIAATGEPLSLLAAWTGALAYTGQLYFDFSGYSDMAIGAALLFGIRLPVNFASPYKAASITDFWRRWHITLSRFLRDYLYIPLGGSRRGRLRRFANLLLTMLLGGLWHGANWTFVLWGGLHGVYLIVNYVWRAFNAGGMPRLLGRALTFLSVVIAWVFFRAADTGAAFSMLRAMTGFHGMGLLSDEAQGLAVSLLVLLLCWLAPNTQQITGYTGPAGSYGEPEKPTSSPHPQWHPTQRWAVITGCLFAMALMSASRISEFIYFQF